MGAVSFFGVNNMAVFSDIRHIETEMLIVGAGVAGMMAATAALLAA